MLAALVRECDLVNPEFKRKREAGIPVEPGEESLAGKPGQIINRPDAYKLVRSGMAVPADNECRTKAGLDDAEIQRRVEAMKRFENASYMDFENGKLVYEDAPKIEGDYDKSSVLFLVRPVRRPEPPSPEVPAKPENN